MAEFTTTAVTLAPIPFASGSWVKDWMAEENVGPFCSSSAFSETGVLESKNFSQFAVISAAASRLTWCSGGPRLVGDERPERRDEVGAAVVDEVPTAAGRPRHERQAKHRSKEDPASRELESHDTPH